MIATVNLEGEFSMPVDTTADVNFDAEAVNLEGESMPKDATADVDYDDDYDAEAVVKLEGESTMPKDSTADVNYDADAASEEPYNEKEVNAEDLDGFWERQARRMARHPRTHLCSSFLLALVLSAIGLGVGEFSISSETGGWDSRGTLISDRQTQLLLTQINQEYLFTGGDDAWEDLLNNVQSGWDEDDTAEASSRRLKLTGDSVHPGGSRVEQSQHALPFEMTSDMRRRLQEQTDLLPGCDIDWYFSSNLTDHIRLWPLWKTQKKTDTALSPQIIHDICVAEENTQRHLEEKGLCFGCDEGCLPPYSIVLYTRLLVPNGIGLSCQELRDEWGPYQATTEVEWKKCVEDVKANYSPYSEAFPESCPFAFSTMMVDEAFEQSSLLAYTSSIFATEEDDIDELYDSVDSYDRGSSLIKGAYDTQDEDFAVLYTDEALNRDMILAMGSAVFVALAIVVHTKSPFITLIGLLQIIFSLPLSYFVYKLVAGLDFFPFLNFIGVFVIFALGADDVFVAVDKWKNARLEHPKATTEYIAAVALPDAAGAMFLTTLTTAVAFFATAICPVAPIKLFGVFCGLLVVFDYIMNVLLVFPALCIYDKALESTEKEASCCIRIRCSKPSGEEVETEGEDPKPSFILRAINAFYVVLHRIRWFLLVACAVAFGVSAYYASTLSLPDSADVRMLGEDVQFEQNWMWRKNLLYDTLEKGQGSGANVIWGVKPADTGDHNNPASFSQLKLDSSFDPSSEEAQLYLLGFCDDLFDQEFAANINAAFSCPLQKFDMWLKEQSNVTLPDDIYVEHCSGATGIPVVQEQFHPCIVSWTREVGERAILSRNDKVKIIFFPFMSRVRFDDQYNELDDEWNLIEKWINKENSQAPSGVSRVFFSSQTFWWYDTNGQMLSTAISSATIALVVAAVVLLLFSRSFVLTIFATLTILYVLLSVTAMLVGIGWTLGFMESICFAILIGVSVDFVMHFSHAYTHLPGDASREKRTKHALVMMGPSILAAAFTTIASAIIMLFTVILFFQKFATILCFTVIQATIGSFIVFLTMTICIGPSQPTHSVDTLVAKLFRRTDDSSPQEEDEGELMDRTENTERVTHST